MTETVNFIGVLKAQQDQLKRLLDMKLWVTATPKATLDEMDAQLCDTKALIADLENLIKRQRSRL
jgi:hypothetical protein